MVIPKTRRFERSATAHLAKAFWALALVLSLPSSFAGRSLSWQPKLGSYAYMVKSFEGALFCSSHWIDARTPAVAANLRRLEVQTKIGGNDDLPFFDEYRFNPPLTIFGVQVDRILYEGDSGAVFVAFAHGDMERFAARFHHKLRPKPNDPDLVGTGWEYGGAYYVHSAKPSIQNPYPLDIFIGKGKHPGTFQFGCQAYDG